MGLQFGHYLGLPGALRGLPLSPLVPRYQELIAFQRALGLRHVGDALVDRGRTLRVLDGVFEQRSLRAWQRVDTDSLRRLPTDRGVAFAPLVSRLASLNSQDPTALRRVLLYQLVELLQSHPQGATPDTAVSLGVCADEAAALVQAAASQQRLDARQRSAAEDLEDVWQRAHVRSAARMAALLPAGAGGDEALNQRISDVAARLRLADSTLDEAQRIERTGDLQSAGSHYLRAAQLAEDCPRALRGLVRTHRPDDEEHQTGGAQERERINLRGSDMRVDLATNSVKLSWPGSTTRAENSTWRVIRLTRRSAHRPVPVEIPPRPGFDRWTDTDPPYGYEVRYAALPLHDGKMTGPSIVSRSLLVAPDVASFRSLDGRGRIEAHWVQPTGALGVRVELTGPAGRVDDVELYGSGFNAVGLDTGDHRIRITCRYRSADGSEIESAGFTTQVAVPPWPAPVLGLSAAANRGRARFTWTGGEGAEVRLVAWPGEPPAPGAELHHDPATPWPAGLNWEASAEGLTPPAGTVSRVSALAILGQRAVAGPSIRVEAPPAVTSLTVERTAGDLARISFAWPPQTGEVSVVLHQDGKRSTYRVTRSAFLHEGLYVPVSRSRFRIAVSSAPLAADATLIPPVNGETDVPADVAVIYRIVPGPRRALRRRRATVRVSLSLADSEPPTSIPGFVLIAKAGDERAPMRPRHQGDGMTVLRLSGDELHRLGTVVRELPHATRPYALRGFLVGDGAAAVRLDEPSPATLVVR